jgi:predicted ATPase/DNA-binding CsgD family transcriptional regulator
MPVESYSEGIRSADFPSRLGSPPSRLLDREDDLAAIRSLLLADEVRLLTLTGPGGVGKTRLALEVAGEVYSHFTHGVVLIDLTHVRDPEDVLPAMGEDLGFRNLESQTLLDRLQTYLAKRELLLIVDNVEQVLLGVSGLAERLVVAPRVKLLVTSREALHLRWEQVFHVPPLALPDPRHIPPLKELVRVPSVALFLQRATAVDPEYALTEDNAQAVAELCIHLDGLPLAIELGAARTSLLSPQMILERLGQRLSLLRWQARDLPQRQQTLRSAIAWSYDLLSFEEQTLFRHLGVFAGSFSLQAAEAIAEPLRVDAIEGLASLVDKSLVQVRGRDLDDVRYVLLESIREYALERLEEAGESEEARRVHARYYLALAERAEPELTGWEQRVWFGRLESAHDNLRAALRWLLDHDETELALRLATALGYFWLDRGYIAEGRRQLEEAVIKVPEADPRLRARSLSRLGALLIWMDDQAEHPRAVLTEALELARSVQDPLTIARSLSLLGVLGVLTKESDQGRRYLEESLTFSQEVGDDWGIASTLVYLGAEEVRQGRRQEGMRLLEDSVARYREIGDGSAGGLPLFLLVRVAGDQQDAHGAVTHLQELLELSIESQSPRLLYLCGEGVTWLLREQGDPEQLTRLLGATQQLRDTAGLDRGKIVSTAMLSLPITAQALQGRLGQQAFEEAVAEGRSLTFQQMVALIGELLEAAAQRGASERVSQEPPGATILSPREHDVLRLVAEGRSNKQIAKELIIAESTAKYYVTGVFNKLGVDSRAQAVAIAAQRGLL